MRILLDTNLLVRAAISPDGLARKLLIAIEEQNHVLIVFSQLLGEVAAVLGRPRLQRRWPLSQQDIQKFCRGLARVGEDAPAHPLAQVISDPKDQMVVDAAVAARADFLCTLDAHFYEAPVLSFCQALGIKIVGDAELLDLIRSTR